MPFSWDNIPYTNFHELNIDYFINKFKEIFTEWANLYNTLTTWKDTTTTELETWKTQTENDILTWENSVISDLNTWKSTTETDISSWETATLNALDAWKTATTAIFEAIRIEAAGSATAAANSATAAGTAKTAAEAAQAAAEAAAASVSASAAQITTNANDISNLKTATNILENLNTQETEYSVSNEGRGKWEISGTTVSYVSADSGSNYALKAVSVSENDAVQISFRPATGAAIIFANLENNVYTVVDTVTFGDEHEVFDGQFIIGQGITHVLMTKYGTGRTSYCNRIEQKTDKTLTESNIAADSKTVGDELNSLSEIIGINKEIDKANNVTVLNCYMRNADGELRSSSTEVHTLYFKCNKNTLYRIDHELSGRFIAGCFTDVPAENSVPTSFIIGTSADKQEDSTFIMTDSTAEYIAAYFYSKTYELDTYENTYNAIKIYVNPVDVSLTQSGIPADAKTVGDKFKIAQGGFYVSKDEIKIVNTYSGVIDLYDNLVSQYSEYVTKNTLTKGNITLYEYIFTSGNYNSKEGERAKDNEIDKPIVLIESGIHGTEKSSVMSLYGFCKELCENNYNLSDIINFITLKVIPIVNPTGYDANTRLNENNVNINRNFNSSNWSETSEGPDYSGASPADQYETQIIQEWLYDNTDALIFIDWHNSGYTDEISCLLGNTDSDTMGFKKHYLFGINDIIPYWQNEREIPDTDIYSYTGHTSTSGTAKSYGNDLNITSFTFETSWNVNSTGQNGQFSIGTGEEAIAYLLKGLKKYYKDI